MRGSWFARPSIKDQLKTKKLSYRKDDLTMRPIYGCPENFRESLSTPTASAAILLPKFLMVFLFRSILSMWIQNLKIAALPNTHSWDKGYSKNLDFCSDGPVNVWAKFAVRSFTRSWDNYSDFSFGLGLRTPNLGEREAVGGRDGTVRKSVGEFL